MHLRPEELIDLAEGTRDESDAPHLAVCDACRRQLADLRAMMSSVTDANVEVPEPSPLFWTRLQERVAADVREKGIARFPGFSRFAGFLRPAVLVPVGAVAAIVIAAVVVNINSRVALPTLPDGPAQVASAPPQDLTAPDGASRVELLNDSLGSGDASLQLVADLTTDMDWNTAGETMLGSAEHAVAHLSRAELAELQRLLQAELANAGL